MLKVYKSILLDCLWVTGVPQVEMEADKTAQLAW